MKRKITWVGLVVAVAAVIAAAAAYAVSGGELPADRTSGHVVVQGVTGGDPASRRLPSSHGRGALPSRAGLAMEAEEARAGPPCRT